MNITGAAPASFNMRQDRRRCVHSTALVSMPGYLAPNGKWQKKGVHWLIIDGEREWQMANSRQREL